MTTNGGISALIILALDIWAIVKIFSSSATTGKKVLRQHPFVSQMGSFW